MPPERKFSLDQAQVIISNALNKLNLRSQIIPKLSGDFQSFECQLYNDKSNDYIARGFGKGTTKEAYIGSQFEALENYISVVSNVPIDYYNFSLEELRLKKYKILMSKIPSEMLHNKNYHSKKLMWLKYRDYFQQSNTAYAPVASVNPFYLLNNKIKDDSFPYDEMYIQSSNNGVAIGCSFEEALIHGISEVIERDAISFFLINHFIANTNENINIVNPETITDNLKIAYTYLMNLVNITPILIRMPSEFDVPAFCTVIVKQDSTVSLKGFGASLCAEHALMRSICECIEQVAFYDGIASREYSEALAAFSNIPSFKNCVIFDVNNLIENNKFENISFPILPKNLPTNLTNYLGILLEKISLNNFSLYYNLLYHDGEIFSIHVIIPEAEDLLNLLKGVVPFIGKRASNHLNNIENHLT